MDALRSAWLRVRMVALVCLVVGAVAVLNVVCPTPAEASSPCAGGQCRVGQAARTAVRSTVRAARRVVTAPVRVTRRALGR